MVCVGSVAEVVSTRSCDYVDIGMMDVVGVIVDNDDDVVLGLSLDEAMVASIELHDN